MKLVTKHEAELILVKNNWGGMAPFYMQDNKLMLPFQTFGEAIKAKQTCQAFIEKQKLSLEAIVLKNYNGIFFNCKI